MLYRIAGLTVDMQPKHELLRKRAAAYRGGDGVPDMVLREDTAPLLPDMNGTPEALEYARLGAAFYEALPAFDGLLLHASAVALDGRAYAFSAPSGTGKSTHAALWKTVLGAEIINDDKPALRLLNEGFCACGTPFSGKTDQSLNRQVPLAGIAFLRRGASSTVERMNTPEALWELLNATLRFPDVERQERLLLLLDRLLKTVPIFRLTCGMTADAARAAYEGMNKA